MKVLFLDIDGVLNTDKDVYVYGSTYINPYLIHFLKFIVLSTNSSIVLNSNCSLSETAKKIIQKNLYIKKLYLLDTTVVKKLSMWTKRSEEISFWLSSRPQVKKFAIIDDDPDAGTGFSENFFQTDPEVGLTIELAEKIVDHLNY